MVHLRINEKEANPNPHVNFITPLSIGNSAAEEDARQLLRALAAQVKPIMRAHGFVVNSFEEYEYNKVFAGRNWNNGETVEIVLRNAAGSYYPTTWLMSTLCHELAHIKYMNHGPAFQALWARLRREIRDLQMKGYYGDGFWSAGARLIDGARVGGEGLEPADLPEYMCGGALTRARPSSLRRRRTARTTGPSLHTGAQTAKKRKAGSRVTAKSSFKGEGTALNAAGESGIVGTGFGKRAGSKKAREERALAIECRLKTLAQKTETIIRSTPDQEDVPSDDDEDAGRLETDHDRRRTLLETADTDLEGMKTSWSDVGNEFTFPSSPSNEPGPSRPRSSNMKSSPSRIPSHRSSSIIVIEDSDEEGGNCDTRIVTGPGGTTATSSQPPNKKQKISYGSIVKEEVRRRKKEALGMSGPGWPIGGSSSRSGKNTTTEASQATLPETLSTSTSSASRSDKEMFDQEWSCLVCTLNNKSEYLACSACATPRGDSTWSGSS